MGLHSVARRCERFEYVAPARSRVCRLIFADLFDMSLDSSAQLIDAMRAGTMFVDQPALFGLEVLNRILDRGKHVRVVEPAKPSRSHASLRANDRSPNCVEHRRCRIVQ